MGPAASLRNSGTATQDLSATTLSYDFGTSGNNIGTVNAGSDLTIPVGQYEGFNIDSKGVVTASYADGQGQMMGQLSIATVCNAQGQAAVGSTEYQATTASGTAGIGIAGAGGRGTPLFTALRKIRSNTTARTLRRTTARIGQDCPAGLRAQETRGC